MKFFDVVEIGDSVMDGKVVETITNKTSNSIEVTRTARSKNGVDCKQWFTMKDFEDSFKPLNQTHYEQERVKMENGNLGKNSEDDQ